MSYIVRLRFSWLDMLFLAAGVQIITKTSFGLGMLFLFVSGILSLAATRIWGKP